MKDYKELINELTSALDKLPEHITLDNFGDMHTANYKIARVIGILRAWDNMQEEEIDEMGRWAEELVNVGN